MSPLSYTDLPYDPVEAITHLSENDARLAALIHAVGEYRLEYRPTQDLFTALSRAIVYQQLSGKAASTIHGRFLALYGDSDTPSPSEVLDTDVDVLRSVGLSGAKSAAIRDLAEKTIVGVVPSADHLSALDDLEIKERLTTVRGVGPWTVEMFLMFRLGRPDVMPATDLGIRKGYAKTFGKEELPAPKAILDHSEDWKPFRTVASWYLWRSLELGDAEF